MNNQIWNIRGVSPELRHAVKISAAQRNISIGAWMIWAIENHLELCEKLDTDHSPHSPAAKNIRNAGKLWKKDGGHI